MKNLELIRDERLRQINEEGWSEKHDAAHTNDEIARAASCYASPEEIFIERNVEVDEDCTRGIVFVPKYFEAWPWDKEWDKRHLHDRKKQLIIAGALIVAELDRLDNVEE